MRILFLGDIVGRPGRTLVRQRVKQLRSELELDVIIANCENASGGVGVTSKNARELLASGIDVLTSGNHVWKMRDIQPYMEKENRLVRPQNYPGEVPGRGWHVYSLPGLPDFAVINLLGRTYMDSVECPFHAMDSILAELDERGVKVRVVDFHAEATSEKTALGWMLDGKVSAVLGTHTHIQTSDARLLNKGTAYITDAGMCGPADSCLGMEPEIIISLFRTKRPVKFRVAEGPCILQGAIFDIDETSGMATAMTAWQEKS